MPAYQKVSRNASERRSLRTFSNNITRSADGVNQLGLEILVHFVPQSADPRVNDVGMRIEIVVPDMLHDHGPGNHLPGIAHEVFEEGELTGLKFDLPSRS